MDHPSILDVRLLVFPSSILLSLAILKIAKRSDYISLEYSIAHYRTLKLFSSLSTHISVYKDGNSPDQPMKKTLTFSLTANNHDNNISGG